MKRFIVSVLAAVLVAGMGAFVMAAEKSTETKKAKPKGIVVEVVQWTGTVKAIDSEKQTVTIEGEDGKTVTLNARHAKNLDQVKAGDKVNAQYVEELAIFVRKADTPASAKEVKAVALAPQGQMPGGVMVDTIEIQANVQDINHKKHTITLESPDGKVKTFHVRKRLKGFKDIQKGDQVVLRFSESLALEVAKP